MWFAITAICVVLSMLYYYIFEMKIARQKQLTSNMPHPTPLPIFGNSLEFGSKSDEILSNFHRIVKTYGKVVRLWIGTELYVVLSDVNHIQTILTSNKLLKKAHVYDLLDPWLGAGLLTSDGDEWRRQRKIITPTFHFKILEQFVDTFSASSNILTDKLKKEVGNNGFDVSKLVVLCTLDIICETSMGTEVNAQLQKENSFVSAIHDVAISVLQRALRPWLFPDMFFRISPTGQLFYKQLAVINNFIQEVIQNRRQKKEEQKAQNQNDEDALVFGQKKKTAFLDMLIDYNMSDEEIRDQVNTFMFAGHDTTTSAISFTLYCLMKYPDVQEKVYNEIKEVIGDSEEPVTIQNLKDLKYLDCVISETQRLYPSVPYIGRRITEDVQLTPEYILPKGCSVNLFFYQLHRDPELFEDPEVYNPDRFLPDEIQKRHPFAYCPFSAGSRNCVGQKFAILEVKSVLSSIIRKFKLLPPINCPDVIVGSELVLRSVTGVYIKLENR